MANQDAPPTARPVTDSPSERAGMPLSARRLILIGSVCVLAGVLAGRFLFGGLVLASAGIALLATALSYGIGRPWFSPISWFVAIAGLSWTALTAAYGWSIPSTASPSAPPGQTSLLFYSGAAALALMTGGTLAAGTLRILRRRRKNPAPTTGDDPSEQR